MSKLNNLPLKIEEDLAETVGCLIQSGVLKNYVMEDMLKKIAFEMRLRPEFKKILSDPDWIKLFKKRWSHKFRQDGAETTSSQNRAVSLPKMKDISIVLNKLPDEEFYNGRNHGTLMKYSNRRMHSVKVACVKPLMIAENRASRSHNAQAPSVVSLNNGSRMKHDKRKMRFRESSEEFDARGKSENSFLPCGETNNNLELASAGSLRQETIKRASMGLRNRTKNVNRFESDENSSSESEYETTDVSSQSEDNSYSDSETDDSETTYTKLKAMDKRNNDNLTPSRIQPPRRKHNLKRRYDTNVQVTSRLRKKIKPVYRFQSKESIRKRHKSTEDLQPEISKSKTEEPDATEISSDEDITSSVVNVEDHKGRKNFQSVLTGVRKIEDLCLACGKTDNINANHPLFIGGLCDEHKILLHEWFFKYDSDGYHSCCSVCYMGNKVVLCDVQDCGRCYCKDCLDTLVERQEFDDAINSKRWVCNFCFESPKGLLQKRPEWQEEIQRLFQNTVESRFPPFSVPVPIPVRDRRPIRVLSLFDGIATGVVALRQLGLEIEKFVASEIDEDAIRLVQNKHPDVIHIGDITKVTDEEIYKMGPFDLLLGGSPCNDLSGANPRRRGLLDAEGSGCLFFDFYRILRTIEPPRDENRKRQRPFFWLFENVVSMKGIEKERISRFLQCEPKMADARYVSAAARPRLFWGNLPGLKDRNISPGVNDRLTVQECLETNRTAQVQKLNTITTKYTCLYQGVTRCAPVLHEDKQDVLWTTELERVFGVPEHYTDVNNLGPRDRLALLGRSWSVPVVRLLLAPLKEYFSGVQQIPEKKKCVTGSWWS